MPHGAEKGAEIYLKISAAFYFFPGRIFILPLLKKKKSLKNNHSAVKSGLIMNSIINRKTTAYFDCLCCLWRKEMQFVPAFKICFFFFSVSFLYFGKPMVNDTLGKM